jgi:hypothetical protein
MECGSSAAAFLSDEHASIFVEAQQLGRRKLSSSVSSQKFAEERSE